MDITIDEYLQRKQPVNCSTWSFYELQNIRYWDLTK